MIARLEWHVTHNTPIVVIKPLLFQEPMAAIFCVVAGVTTLTSMSKQLSAGVNSTGVAMSTVMCARRERKNILANKQSPIIANNSIQSSKYGLKRK